MRFITDLHIHGRYSQGTSNNLDFKSLEKYGQIKGLDIMGTGDFSHPKWLKHIKSELKETGNGLLKTKTGYKFLLQTEFSFIYSQDGRGRRVHLVILAPDLDTVEQINDFLHNKKGFRVDYDGRPIFGKYPCYEFVEDMMKINKDIEIIPAHIWTPWFSLFGDKSGFDKIEDCFKDQTKNIHALETGLSSDPAMNWRLSALDRFTLVSNSDSHSFWPWRIGREANVFNFSEDKLSYKSIINAIRTRKNFEFTIEVDPAYGKYHEDGHRKCNIKLTPKEALKLNNMCPVCGKKLTIGVSHRVEELADREEGFRPEGAVDFKRLIPLSEVLSELLQKGIATKTVWSEYNKILKSGKNELDVLLNVSFDKLRNFTSEKIAKAIILNREGKVEVDAGYDGVYGIPHFFDNQKNSEKTGIIIKKRQKNLNDFW